MQRPLSMLGAWIAAALLLAWPSLPSRWRRTLALAVGAAGLLFLVAAIQTEGLRETETTVVYLMGAPYVTERASALASLPLYVLTGVCLALGSLGLVAGDALVARLERHWLAFAIAASCAATALRFVLEKTAAPPAWAEPVGITWITPVVGACFAWQTRRAGLGVGRLALALLAYGLAVRAAVAALMVTASLRHWGSHYDVSRLVEVVNPLTGTLHRFEPGGLQQLVSLAVLPQLVVWPLYTLLSGLLGGALLALLARLWPGDDKAREASAADAPPEPR